ncbi:hypothetical protein HYT24_00845 [Candidatus Pacearchaeota archaeon]|nr:hypothetical protein [Candidatus Pacearchaeota archaeon]
MVFEEFWKDLSETLGLLGSNVGFVIGLIQFIGGLIVIYIIFTVWKIIMERKNRKMIQEMRNDIRFIKNRLNKKK